MKTIKRHNNFYLCICFSFDSREAQISNTRRHLAVMSNRLTISSFSNTSNWVALYAIEVRQCLQAMGNAMRQLNYCRVRFCNVLESQVSPRNKDTHLISFKCPRGEFLFVCAILIIAITIALAVFTYYRIWRLRWCLSHFSLQTSLDGPFKYCEEMRVKSRKEKKKTKHFRF